MATFVVVRPATAKPKLEPTLCTDQEIELFSCPIRSKVVSVCAVPGGKATYRFGRPGHVELQSSRLHKAENGYSGGGEDQIDAEVDGYTYTVYARTVRTGFGADGHNDPQFTSGLVVQKNGSHVLSAQCGGEGDQTINSDASQFMPNGTFVNH